MIGETAQLILDRMKSHPEDFFRHGSGGVNNFHKWNWLFTDEYSDVLTSEERTALQAEYNKVRQKEVHARVMTAILDADSDSRNYIISDSSMGIGTFTGVTTGRNIAKTQIAPMPLRIQKQKEEEAQAWTAQAER